MKCMLDLVHASDKFCKLVAPVAPGYTPTVCNESLAYHDIELTYKQS